MSGKKPLISIVMPTHNRARLLPLALHSALDQTLQDIEVVVSDNFSSDETAKVCQDFNDPRIKYFRSEKLLSVGDSWQFAISHAKGRYLSFLPDDDAFVPSMLERLFDVMEQYKSEVVACQAGRYYHDGDIDFGRKMNPNTLAVSKFDGEVTKFDSSEAIKLLYRSFALNDSKPNHRFFLPKLPNTLYHSSIFDRIRAVNKNFIHPVPGDVYIAAAVCSVTDFFCCLDLPLFIWSNWQENETASPHKKGNKFKEHYEKLMHGEGPKYTPLKSAIPYNNSVNVIIQAKTDFKIGLREAEIDWVSYYLQAYESLMYLKGIKVNVDKDLKEFWEKLEKENIETRNRVISKTREIKFAAKQLVRQFPSAILLAKKLLKTKGENLADIIVVDGEKAGFRNVLEAADYLEKNYLK